MGKDQKTEQKATVKMIDVEVRAGYLETRDGIKAKKGDVISIPADGTLQTPSIRQALRSGNLRSVRAQTDLAPVTSEPAETADGTNVKTLE